MAAISRNIQQVSSWQSLLPYAQEPLPPNIWGVLVVDIDRTLLWTDGLGGDQWWKFFQEKNQEIGLPSHTYHEWAERVRVQVPWRACEAPKIIHSVLEQFQSQGWSVVALTTRSDSSRMTTITQEQFKEAKLNLELKDVLFTKREPKTRLAMPKDVTLCTWLKKDPRWVSCEEIRILCLDDSRECCQQLVRLGESVRKATVSCFEYIRVTAQIQLSLSEEQLQYILVQLHAYHQKLPIPRKYTQEQVISAKRAFGIFKINQSSVYEACYRIAALDTFPIASKDKKKISRTADVLISEMTKAFVVASLVFAAYYFIGQSYMQRN